MTSDSRVAAVAERSSDGEATLDGLTRCDTRKTGHGLDLDINAKVTFDRGSRDPRCLRHSLPAP